MPGYEVINWQEKKALNNIFDEGAIFFAHGFEKLRKKFHVREFEKKCQNYFKSKYCLMVSSGTAAIKIGLKSLNIKKGDHVLTQSFNFIATIEAILDIGALPKIVEVDDSLNMCPKDLKKKITRKTRAVIPVHMLGFSADMNSIRTICKKQKIKILEDNCESIGAKSNKKFLGTLGDIGVFSFDFGKIITTGEGGLILTNNKKIFNYCKEYHDHGHMNLKNLGRGNDLARINGFNYRTTEFQGAIGKVQLSKLKKLISSNKKKYLLIERCLKEKFKLRKMHYKTTSNYDTFIFFVENNIQKKKILTLLKNMKIGTKNLPDSIKWHCSYYWKHCLPNSEIKKSISTKKKLEKAIAIPINFKINLNKYKILCNQLIKI